jgi:hypothetical protein
MMANMKKNYKKKTCRLDNDKDLLIESLKNVKVHTPTTNTNNNDEDLFAYNFNNMKLTTPTTTMNNITNL